MTSGAPLANRIRDTIRSCDHLAIELPRVSSNEAGDAVYVTRLLRSRLVNDGTDPSLSAHILRLTTHAKLHNSLPKNRINSEDGTHNPHNPQLGRFNGTVSDHLGVREHRQINRETLNPENKPITSSQEGIRVQEAIIEGINEYADALGCEDDPYVRLQAYGADCPSFIGIGGHIDSFPPKVQMSRYPSSKSSMVIVRSVSTEVPTGVSSNVVFRTYPGSRTGSGVAKVGGKDVPYKEHTCGSRPVSVLSMPKKSGGGSTYFSHPSGNGFLPQALYNKDESALMTTHEVTIRNRHRGIIVTLLIDYPFSSVAKAEAAMAIMKRNP